MPNTGHGSPQTLYLSGSRIDPPSPRTDPQTRVGFSPIRRRKSIRSCRKNWTVCEPRHTHARTFALHPPVAVADRLPPMHLTLEGMCHMQTRCEESRPHGWPWASDVTWALVCLIVGPLLVLASVTVPA